MGVEHWDFWNDGTACIRQQEATGERLQRCRGHCKPLGAFAAPGRKYCGVQFLSLEPAVLHKPVFQIWGHVKSCLKKRKSTNPSPSHWARRNGTEAMHRWRRCHFKADNYVCHLQDQDVATSPDCILMFVYSQLETCFHKLAKQHLKSRDLILSAAHLMRNSSRISTNI